MSLTTNPKLSVKRMNDDYRRSVEMGRVRDSLRPSLDRAPALKDEFQHAENFILIRLSGWNEVLKALVEKFRSMAVHERAHSVNHDKGSKVGFVGGKDNELAFHKECFANQIIDSFQTSQLEIAKGHVAVADTYENNIINPVREIKSKIKVMHREVNAEKIIVEKEREADALIIRDLHKTLSNSITYFTNHKVPAKSLNPEKLNDPWLVSFNLKKAIVEARARHVLRVEKSKAAISRFIAFEESIYSELKTTLLPLGDASAIGSIRKDAFAPVMLLLASMDPKKDFETFTTRYSDFHSNTEPLPDRDVTNLDHPLVQIIIEGPIEKPKTSPIAWKESYGVLTACGFLYDFADKEDVSIGEVPLPLSAILLSTKTMHPDDLHPNEFFLSEGVDKVFGHDQLLVESFKVPETDFARWTLSIQEFSKMTTVDPVLLSSATSIKSIRSTRSRASSNNKQFALFRSNSDASRKSASRKSVDSAAFNTRKNSGNFFGWGSSEPRASQDIDTYNDIEPRGTSGFKKFGKGKKIGFTPSTVGGSEAAGSAADGETHFTEEVTEVTTTIEPRKKNRFSIPSFGRRKEKEVSTIKTSIEE